MNSRLDFIFARRSIRRYREEAVPLALITDLLEAAMAAPSAVAKDPWHFLVVRERATLLRIAQLLPHGKMLRQAGAAIVVVGDLNRVHDHQESYLLQDLSAAVENLLLAAPLLGLGACWLGVHPRAERMAGLAELFALPAGIIPICAIAVGWPAEEPPPRTRYRQECVHLESW